MEKLEEVLRTAAKKIISAARKKRHMQKFFEDFDTALSAASEDAIDGNFNYH